jgi:hypothetical protein
MDVLKEESDDIKGVGKDNEGGKWKVDSRI